MDNYHAYKSPFDSFPLLRSRLRRTLPDYDNDALSLHRQGSFSMDSSASSSSSLVLIPDLQPLKRAASVKALDPCKQICQYELPGGGVCRDAGCEDVHLRRGDLNKAGMDGIEPSGT